ncbi:hypothetical protein ABFV05_007573 [Capra hircus]
MGGSKTSVVLLSMVLFSGTSSDTHSLSYNFTIDPQPRDDQPWCEVQGEVDQKVFLSYDCGTAKIKYMSPLGEEVKSMNAWEAQTVTLRDTGDLLQGQMPDGTPENHTDKGPLTLQARMTCWREDNGHTSASWEFGFNGQLCLLFDSENGHCTVVHPGGRRMKEKWENDRAVTDFFRTVSMGACQAWLQAFLVRWVKMLKTSGDGAPRKHGRCSVVLRSQSFLGCLCFPGFTLEAREETQEFGACLPVMMTRWLHCYSRCFLTSYFCIPVPYTEKDIFFWC